MLFSGSRPTAGHPPFRRGWLASTLLAGSHLGHSTDKLPVAASPAVRRSGWWWLALAAVLLGAALRLWQWSLGTTLFMDELAVVHNLVTRTPAQLVGQHLLEAQVAPPLFLLLEQACLRGLGPSEQALRLPALLGSLLALPLLWAVARRILDERLVPLLLAFAVSFTFVYYSSQVKPYASDVAAAVLVLWLALRLRGTPRVPLGWGVGAALTGLVLPFYSQASLLVLSGCGGMLVLLAWLDPGRPQLRALLAVVGTWAVGCLASLALAQHNLQPYDRLFMRVFWHEGMLPPSPQLPRLLAGDLTERLANGLGWPHPALLWVALAALGLGLLVWQQRGAALLLLGPWLMAVLAAMLQQFPLRGRLMDFLLPSLLLAIFAGWQGLLQWAERRGRWPGLAVLALCAGSVAYSTTRHNLPPYATEDAKPLLTWLAQARRPAEPVYAYYGASQCLRWYGPAYQLPAGSYTLGHCYTHDLTRRRSYLHELDAFRGGRVWVVLMHFDPAEARAITTYLDAIGRRGPRHEVRWRMPDELPGYPLSVAQLWDLTDARRAARYTAATIPLPPPPAPVPVQEWNCYGPQNISD